MKNLSIEAGIQRLSCIILLFCSLFLSSTQQYLNAQTMSGVNPAAYNEGAAPVVLYPGFTFSGGSNYGGGYMLFDITNGDAQDQLAMFNDPNPNALNAISVVGSGVFLGNGTGTDIIGSIDPVQNGQNGQDLRINFTSNFQNAGFESGLAGWTAVNQNVNLGVTIIGGYTSPETGTYPVNAGNDDLPGFMSYFSGVTNTQFSQGSNSLRIWNSGTSASNCDVIHGGYAMSDAFQANGGDILGFDWRAIGGDDNFDVFGYLLNTTTGATTIALDQTDLSGWPPVPTPWTTASVTVPSNGTYRFVFVAGTYDGTCGRALGASLYLDNFIVANNLVNPSIIQILGQHVTYANTCGTSDATRNITVSVVNATNVTTSASSTIALATFEPVITCPSNITVNSPAGQCSAVATFSATATDNCLVGITYSLPSGSTFPLGTSTVTAIATDTYGNNSVCTFNVTVRDVTAPVVNCPTGYTVDVFTNDCVTSVFWAVPTATDNCGNVTVTQTSGIAQGSIQAPGVYTVSYVATDDATPPNTSATCSFNINVIDTENPVIINCPYNNQEILVNASCQAVLPNYAATMQATDNCGYTWSQTPAAGGLYLGGAVVAVTVTATDAAGNSSACSFNVNVIDQIDPVVTCPADITDTNDPGQCGAVVTYNLPTITDNCITCTAPTSLPNFTFVGVLLGHTYFRSNYTSTWTAAQAFATSQGAHLATITSAAENTLVVGNGALAWIGLTDQVTEGTWQWVTGEPLVYTSWAPGEPNNAGGNEDYAITNWNVAGLWNDLPNQSHPFLIEFDCAAAVPTQTAGLPSGSTFPVGTTTNTFSYTDIGGNTAECSFDVIITDTELPVISCAGLSAIRTTSSGGTGDCYGEYAWSHPVPTDNCGIAQYHFTYTNPDGTIDGPFDAIQIANGTMPAAANYNFEIGLTTVSYYVEDIHGNTNTCSFTVTVTDNEAPVFENCPPAGYTVDVFTNDCITDIMWNVPTATDNCSVTVTQTGGVTYGSQQAPGTYTIVYTASDNATPPNTATCSFTIEIADTENPIIQNCPYNNQEIFVDADCEALLPNYTTTINAFDNCGTYTTTQSPLAGAGPYAAGDVVPVTITVTDGNGNSSTCAFDVDVLDDIDPVITCPADITQNNDPGVCGAVVTFADPIATDNCSALTITGTETFLFTGTVQTWVVPVGVSSINVTAFGGRGGNGNGGQFNGGLGASMSGTFSVTPGEILNIVVGRQGYDGAISGAGGGAGGSFVYTGSISGSGLMIAAGGGGGGGEEGTNAGCDAGVNFSTLRNTGSCLNYNNNGSGGTGGGQYGGAGGAGWITEGSDIPSDLGGATGGGHWAGGNGSDQYYGGTFGDGGFGGGGGAFDGGGGGGGYSGGQGNNNEGGGGGAGGSFNGGTNQSNFAGINNTNGYVTIAYDVQGITQVAGLPSGSLFPVGTTTNTFIATDDFGNSSTCSFEVVVSDVEDPVITCPNNVEILTSNLGTTGDCAGQYSWAHPLPTDNCNISLYQVAYANPDQTIDGPFDGILYEQGFILEDANRQFELGVSTVTYYVQDASNNFSTCSFTVTVTDNEAPTFVNCPPAGFTLDVFTNDCTTSANWSIPVAEDNCEVTVTVNAALNSNYPPVTGPEIVPGFILPPGIYTVAYTATDGAGLTASCSFTINVIDTENPIISNCPFDDLTLEVGADCIGNLPDYTIRINTEDNCGPYTVTQVPAPSAISGITYAVGDIISVVITVEDGSANTSTCEFDVLVQDNSLPTVLCNNIGTGAGSGISFVEDFSDNSAGWTLGPEWEIGTVTNNSCSNWCPNQPNTDNTPTPDNGVAGVALNGGCDLGGVLHPMQWLTSPIIDASGVTGTLMLEYYRWLSSDYLPFRSNYVEIYNGTSWVLLQDLSKYDFSPWCDNAWVFNSIDITAFANANLQVRFGWDVSSNGYYPGDSYNIDDFSIIELDATPEPIYLDEDGFASITVADIDGGSFDNCGIQDISLNITDFNCTHVGSNTVTLTVTDVNGNTASCQSEVVVVDTLAPVALCNNMNLTLNEFGNVTISEDDVNNGSTDNCAIGNIQLDQTFFDCSDLGQNIVTLTVTDIYGNTSTCESTVTVTDNEAPAFVNCPPAGFTLDVFTNDCVTSANWSIPVAEDNCDVTVTVNASLNSNYPPVTGPEIVPGVILPPGIYTVAYTATDGAGLTALCSFTINVIDTENPVIINCPYNDQEIFVDADCEAVLPNYATTMQATDNCSYTWSQTPLAGTVFTAGDIVVVTVTATDAAGNFTECTFNVNVLDTIPPSIECPVDITVANDAGICGAVVTYEEPLYADNCPLPNVTGVETFVYTGQMQEWIVPAGVTEVTLEAWGAQGGGSEACDGSIQNDGGLGGFATGKLNVTPGSTLNIFVGEYPGLNASPDYDVVFPGGWNGGGDGGKYGAAGGGASDIRVGGTNLNDRVIVAGGGGGGNTGCPDWGAGGNGGGLSGGDGISNSSFLPGLGGSQIAGGAGGSYGYPGLFGLGASLASYSGPYHSAGGGGGWYGGGSAVPSGGGGGSSYVSGLADSNTISGARSGHGEIRISYMTTPVLTQIEGLPSGSVFPIGTTTNTFVVTDASGNTATCSFDVTVFDGEDPQITCPQDTVILTSDMGTIGDCYGQFEWTHPVPSDNCGLVSYSVTYVNPDGTIDGPYDVYPATISSSLPEQELANRDFQLGLTTITYVIEDAAGHIVNCSFTVTVTDDEAPEFVVCPPAGFDVDVFTNDCVTDIFWVIPVAEDNCSVTVVQTQGPAYGSSVGPGSYYIEYVATDGAGLTDTCSFTINVIDTENPVIINCPYNDQEIFVDADCEAALPDYAATMQATDNCDYDWAQTPVAGSIFTFGDVVVVSVTATDAAGNSTTCTFNVNVLDTIPPTIDCPADIAVANDAGICGAVVAYEDPIADDNCGLLTGGTGISEMIINGDFETGDVSGWNAVASPLSGGYTGEYVINDGTLIPLGPNPAAIPPISGTFDLLSNQDGPTLYTLDQAILVPATVGSAILSWDDIIQNYHSSFITDEQEFKVEILDAALTPVYEVFRTLPGDAPIQYGPNSRMFDITTQLQSLANQVIYIRFTQTVYDWFFNLNLDNISLQVDAGMGSIVQTSGLPSGAIFPVGTTINTFVVTDAAGNTTECSFNVTVTDDEAPEITCPANEDALVTSSGGAGDCEGQFTWEIPYPTDNCEVLNYTVTYTNPDGTVDGPYNAFVYTPGNNFFNGNTQMAVRNFELGTTTVTYFVEDIHGNTNSCSFTVTVTDDEAPEFVTCPPAGYDVDVFTNDCVTDIYWVIPAATDNCSVTVAQTQGPAYGTSVGPGSYFIEYVATDGAGLTDTCSFTINVIDTENPVIINCPYNDQEIFVDDACEVLLPDYAATMQATDNCSYTWAQTPLAGTLFTAKDVVVVTVTATDPSGNSTTCTFNVNVLDTIPPTIECPADIVVSNDPGVCGAQVEYDLPVIGDNCPISIGGMQTFTYNGNAETWTVPAGITQISAQVCGAQGGHVNGGAGACLTVELSVTPGQVLEIYSGGQGSVGGSACAAGEGGEASYIAQGGIPLVVAAGGGGGLQCPGEPSLYGGVGNDGLTTTIGNRNSPFPWGTGGSGGNGGAAGPGSWGTGGGGGWYSTGGNGGGSTGGALLGQPSNFAPFEGFAGGAGGGYNGAGGTGMDGGWGTASGAGGGSYYTGNLVSSAAGAQLMNGMVIISYQSATLVQTEGLPSGSVFPVGTTTNTFVVTDASGNTAQCSFDVTVTDDEDPVIICPENVTITTSNLGTIGDCTGQYNWDHPLATDNCIIEGYWFVYTNPDGSIDGPYDVSGLVNGPIEVQASHKFDLGITTVTYYAVDPSGNEFTCEFTVTVTDNEFPVWNPLPQDLTLECDGTTDPYNQIQFWLNTNGGGIAYDNCGPVTYSNNYTGYTVGCSQNTHTSMVTFTATDPNGNSTSVEVSLTIIDTQAPIITTMARDTIVECDGLGNTADLASWLANHGGAIAEDVCSEPLTWGYTLISTTGTCGGTFTSRYAFRATDACGNISVNTEALFIIVDTTVPQFDVLPQDSIVQCDGVGNTTQLAGWLASNAGLVASDVCNEVVEIRYDLIQETDLCGITGSGLYRFTILDACGNKNFADASFIIVDTIPPAITGGEDMVMEECDDPPAGNYPEFDFWLTNNAGATAEDVCGSFEWSNNFHLDNWIQQCGNTKYVDVTFYATDICGNVDSIIHRFSIGDVTPPVFVNCPRPDIVVDVPTNLCESYVNFSMPYAIDNCGSAVVTQTDTTGLTSGDLFPVGCTILEFTATDDCGNQTVCYLRIIVNDNHTPPVLECPESVETVNDPGFCGAIVDELAPVVTDNCPDHVFVSYTIQDESGEVIGSGVEDASGTEFPVGVNTVTYTAYDQPQFLITEVLQDGMVTGVEIGNFGPAAIDLGCAVVKRTNSTADEEYSQHHGTVVGAGEVHVVQFTPIPAGNVATYSIEFKDRIVDMITINDGLDGVDIFRISAIDTDTNDDFEVVNACTEGSFGLWNPQLPTYADNGITTKMQSVHPNQTSCSFTVTVVDVESPVCGEIDTLSFSRGGMTIGDDLCVSSVFTLPAGKIAKINIQDLIADVQNAGLVTVTLTGPDGTRIVLLENTCAGTSDINVNLDDIAPTNVAFAGCDPLGNGSTFAPMTSMFTFFGAESAGNWTLELYTDAPNSGTLTNWTIEFLLYSVFDQEDIVAENDPGLCGADVTWVHPYFLDNCIEGSMTVTYSFNNDVTGESYEITEVVLSSGGSIDLDGMPVTRYFEVGVTTITYTLTDQYGHISYCGFTVTVLDTEAPVFPNGCADFVVTLDPGLCYGNLTVFPEVTDNCALESLIYYYPDGSVVDINQIPIGNNEIWAVATDIYGNADTCIFNFRVIEYIPTNNAIACNDNVSISLDADCHAEITADMVLEGNNYRCYENYCLTITDQYGNIHPNAFDYSDAGQTFMVTVTDCLGGGNSCMSEVTVMEKWVPEIECPEDATVSCNASIDPSVLGVVKILNCEPFATIEYIDEYIDNGICGNPRAIINRNWIVNDHQGNIVNCTQIITIEKSTLAQVVFPKDVLNLSCQYANQNPQAVHPDQTGYPTVDGIGVNINDGLCMFSYLWTDEVYNYCGNSFEILRTWKVRDMCGPVNAQNPRTHVQVIRVFDTTPPEICSCEDYYVNADAFRCEGSIDLPLPCITDDCSQIKSIKVFVSGAAVKITGNYAAGTLKVRVYNMKLGTYPARWVVEDACGNRSSCNFKIVVEDKFPPIAVCEQYKQVGITLTGSAKVAAKSFDSGSWDNCKPVWFKVWRGDGGCMDLNCDNTACTQQWFDDDVYFCCADADKEVMVTLRVFEVDPGVGPVNPSRMLPGGDLYGHFNDCMTTTLVKDKSVPLMACEDVTITCEDNKDPEHTGYPYVLSTCGVYELEYSDNLSTLNHCGIGYFTRTWQVFVGGEKQGQCNQRIYVTATLPFDPLTIVFPYISQETCLKPEPTGEQTTWTTNPCNIVEASIIKVDTFRFVEDACYKILREWAVIDWCVYKPNTGAESNIDEYRYISNNRRAILDPAKFTEADRDGYYRFTEVIMVYDNQAANIVVTDTCLGVVTCITAQNTHKLYATSYEEDEDCGGEYEWTYVIHSECCDDVVQFSSNNNAYKGANYQGGVSGRSSDDKLKGASASMLILPSLEIGRYKVTWTLSDGCGNVTTAYQYIDVADKKAPTPYLVDIATATMTENCMVELTAVFFDKGACDNNCLASYDNCSDVLYFTYTPVLPKIDGTWTLDANGLYYFNPLTGAKSNRSAYLGGTAHSWNPEKQTSGKVFFGPSRTVNVEVYVWDEFGLNEACDDGNYDYATVELRINSEGDVDCPDNFVSVTGFIYNTANEGGINNVEVRADDGSESRYSQTDPSGNFSFVLNEGEYDITPKKRDDYTNGVNTLDLILIQKHILGIEEITGDQLIAADANANGTVTAVDIKQIRDLILGVTTELPKNDSWVFVPSEYSTYIEEPIELRFGGIKVGDVNRSAANNFNATAVNTRQSNSIELLLDEKVLSKGDEIRLEFRSGNFTDVRGMQFTLYTEGLKYIGFESGKLQLSADNLGRIRDEVTTLSWNESTGLSATEEEVLFTLIFEGQQKTNLSSAVQITSQITPAEGYVADELNTWNVDLEFRGITPDVFELFQNEPNPFAQTTLVRFNLPEAGEYEFSVFDVTGKELMKITGEGKKGLNEEVLKATELKQGMLYYQLKFKDFVANRKMILVK